MLSKRFKEDYIVINTPEVWEYKFAPELVRFFLGDKLFWKSINLFIYQFVSRDNLSFEGWATEYCMEKLDVVCTKVAIISLEFSGYFPQMGNLINEENVFTHRDKYADALIKQDEEEGKIIEILSDEGFVPDTEIESCIKKSLSAIKKKDDYADVKIYDYIEENYATEQLFYSPLHPCDNLMREYTKRIFQYLDLKWDIADEDFAKTCGGGIMKGNDLLIYPSVVKKLGLKKYSNRFYFNKEYVSKSMNLDFKQCLGIYIKTYRSFRNLIES